MRFMGIVCILLFSQTIFAQNKAPVQAKKKAQTALLAQRDTTHKKVVPKQAPPRVVGTAVTLSQTGKIVPLSPDVVLPKTTPAPAPLPKMLQPKTTQQVVVGTKNGQNKTVVQPTNASKVVVNQSVTQPVLGAKTVQNKTAQQTPIAPKLAEAKPPQASAIPKKAVPNNLLLASVAPPKSAAVPKSATTKVVKKSNQRPSPATEFRGVWVSTVQQVDFPTTESVDPSVLKSEWLRLLKFYKSMNLNAVIVQVRPTADAIYPSKIVPYSKWLTGESGKPLAGNFDMLKFMVETSHTEGMEFHAWINPYRVLMDNDTLTLAKNHVFKTHRNWVLKYGKEHHLNPGLPEVWKHITAVMEEIVVNYAIDAVHFDDYFYPYRIYGEELKDAETYKKYGKKFKNIDDWRRANTDSMLYNVRQVVKKHKPYVQIGVSPFAVWRNKSDTTATTQQGLIEGSDTRAYQSCYSDLYADVVAWMRKGWLDYVAPEVYFHKNHPLVGYETAVDWWLKNSYGTPVYISHALYKVNNKEKYPEWRDPNEIPRQLDLVRTKQNVKGLVFFSSRWLLENQLGVTDSIRNNFFYQPTKLPKVVVRK